MSNSNYLARKHNENFFKKFGEAVYSAVRTVSQSALLGAGKEMMEDTVKNVRYNDYSGTLIRSYVVAQIQLNEYKIQMKYLKAFLDKQNFSGKVYKGGGTTINLGHHDTSDGVNRYFEVRMNTIMKEATANRHNNKNRIALRSKDLPYVQALRRGDVKMLGEGDYIKYLGVERNHEKPKAISSEFSSLRDYTSDTSKIFNKMHGAIEDAVILTNLAPYAEEVHRGRFGNRVLPAALPEWGKNFYVKRMAKTFKGR